ncbi:hypothetical protein [Pseudonocardia oroxyli]|nr:hypothetical protein [Pseudonocardia oroxyli]
MLAAAYLAVTRARENNVEAERGGPSAGRRTLIRLSANEIPASSPHSPSTHTPASTTSRTGRTGAANANNRPATVTTADAASDHPTDQLLLQYQHRLMCKLPGFHYQYLSAFNRDNVTLVDTAGTGVERITPAGVVAAGREYEIDCLVFATGFDVGRGCIRSSGIDVTGADGADLAQTWAGGMRTLHDFLAHRFPNLLLHGRHPLPAGKGRAHRLRRQHPAQGRPHPGRGHPGGPAAVGSSSSTPS